VTDTLNGLIFASRFRSQIVSRATSEVIIYSASHVDSATIGCLLDLQVMGVLAPKNRYPLVDLQVEISPA
jgi:hypothetical protein